MADALPRVPGMALHRLTATILPSEPMQRIKQSREADSHLQGIIVAKTKYQNAYNNYSWDQKRLLKKGKYVVGRDSELRQDLISLFHSSSVEGGVLM